MTDHDTQEVSDCGACPYGDFEYGDICTRDEKRRRVVNGAPPDWCPLRVRAVLVRLAVKEIK